MDNFTDVMGGQDHGGQQGGGYQPDRDHMGVDYPQDDARRQGSD